MGKYIEMKVHGLANRQVQSGAYALILAEQGGTRRIPVIVGTPEAQSIAIALEKIRTPRPLTHDLLVSLLGAYQVSISHVLIYKFEDGIYYAELSCTDGERDVTIDARTSDAIAIALRVRCQIFILSDILDECGVETGVEHKEASDDLGAPSGQFASDESVDEQQTRRWLRHASEQALHERLKKAIEEENYEYAMLCQEELKRRKEGEEETTC